MTGENAHIKLRFKIHLTIQVGWNFVIKFKQNLVG